MRIKKKLKKLLKKLQSKNSIKSASRPTRTFDEYFQFAKELGFYPGTVIDVGAANGTPSLHKAFPDAYFILIEPLKVFIPKLQVLLEQYRGEIHNCALMAEKGVQNIRVSKDLYGSSLMHRSTGSEDGQLEKVEVNTLDNLINQKEYVAPYILKTDCQGGDYEVVRGGEKTLSNCEIVILEVSFFRFWGDHHPDAIKILNYMDQKGFVIHDFLDGLFRPYDGALGQIDIVFVKKEGMFKEKHNWM